MRITDYWIANGPSKRILIDKWCSRSIDYGEGYVNLQRLLTLEKSAENSLSFVIGFLAGTFLVGVIIFIVSATGDNLAEIFGTGIFFIFLSGFILYNFWHKPLKKPKELLRDLEKFSDLFGAVYIESDLNGIVKCVEENILWHTNEFHSFTGSRDEMMDRLDDLYKRHDILEKFGISIRPLGDEINTDSSEEFEEEVIERSR